MKWSQRKLSRFAKRILRREIIITNNYYLSKNKKYHKKNFCSNPKNMKPHEINKYFIDLKLLKYFYPKLLKQLFFVFPRKS